MGGSWRYGLDAWETVAREGAGGMVWRHRRQLHGRELELWPGCMGDSCMGGSWRYGLEAWETVAWAGAGVMAWSNE